MTRPYPNEPISPLRARMIEDMRVRNFVAGTQRDYIRAVKKLAAFLGRSPDTATAEELRAFQQHLAAGLANPPSINITVPAAALHVNPRNARTHSPKQVAQIAASISEFGFITPILVDKTGEIIAGHGRVAAAKKLGLKTVPCVRIEHLTEAQKRAYILADNRIAENAGWDIELLALELQDLSAPELDFDVTLIGFEMAEIDVLLRSDLGGSAISGKSAGIA